MMTDFCAHISFAISDQNLSRLTKKMSVLLQDQKDLFYQQVSTMTIYTKTIYWRKYLHLKNFRSRMKKIS
ncbi:hypothetical protein SB14R_07850 [Pseudomonas oryzihabitans]|nr:hypothetical protein NS376_13905 [Pseudomonas psychrotolerans]KTT25160.1 hypothetical protein SB14R_07850 [Pseudomonas psychrotolerans]